MKCERWKEYTLFEFIDFNPREKLDKGQKAKKIAMEKLVPFQKKVEAYELSEFNGGSKFRNGDTVMARITPCLENGKTAQISILNKKEVGFGSTEFIVLREKQTISDRDFIYYLSISPVFRKIAIQSMVGSSGRQRVQQSVLDNSVFLFPPLPEQKAIADTLSCLDDKIELNNRMNRTLEEMAQAIFKSWFVNFEPFQDGEFMDSELGKIPKGWRVGTLGEIAEISTKSINPSKTPETLFEHYSIPAYDEANFPVFEKGNNIKSNKYLIPCGAWLISKLNPTTKRVWQPFMISKNAICSTEFIVYSASNLRYRDFCFENTNSVDFFDFLCSNTSGSTNSRQRAIPKETLKYQLVIPTENIVKGFSQLVDPIYARMKNNLVECRRLISLRDSLLPKLMSGEIRVPLEVK